MGKPLIRSFNRQGVKGGNSVFRTETLKRVMRDYGLTARDVSEIVNRKPQTVRVWLMRDTIRPIPQDSFSELCKTMRVSEITGENI